MTKKLTPSCNNQSLRRRSRSPRPMGDDTPRLDSRASFQSLSDLSGSVSSTRNGLLRADNQNFYQKHRNTTNPIPVSSLTKYHVDQFDSVVLSVLYQASLFLLSIFWEYLDASICEFLTPDDLFKFKRQKGSDDHVEASIEEQAKCGGFCSSCARVFRTILYFLVAIVIGIPLLLVSFPFWFVLHALRTRPYRTYMQDSKGSMKTVASGRSVEVTVLSTNVCLLSEVASRVNNLSHNQVRAKHIALKILESQCPCATDNSQPPTPRNSRSPIRTDFPPDIDLICLQEVFQRKSAQKIVQQLSQRYPYIVWDAGYSYSRKLGKTRGFISLENSGLFFASKYPIIDTQFKAFDEASNGDRMASKGVMICSVELPNGKFGLVANTHLQAQESARCSEIRRRQMSYVHSQIQKVSAASEERGQPISFTVLCGDLNFDLQIHDQEALSFAEEFKNFRDIHEHNRFPTAFEQFGGMHEIGDPSRFQRVLSRWRQYRGYFMHETDGQALPQSTKDISRRSLHKRIKPMQLDHIWYDPSGCQLKESAYHTSLCALTDHIPISAKFSVL